MGGGGEREERDRGIIIGLLSISGLIETCWLVGGGRGMVQIERRAAQD